jgi:hypothetical protein
MKRLATLALLLAAPAALAQGDAPTAPKSGTIKLYPVYLTKDETAFVDVALLTRNGDIVEGWGLNIHSSPMEFAPGKRADVHWTRFRMNCRTNSVTITWVLGRDLITTTFAQPMNAVIAITPRSGWDQTHVHACKNLPIFTTKGYASEQVAVALARGEMRRKP